MVKKKSDIPLKKKAKSKNTPAARAKVNVEIFRNAPITEALIDIQLQFEDPVDLLSALEKAHGTILKEFPVRKTLRNFNFMGRIDITDSEENPIETSSETLGHRFWSKDQKHVVTLKKDGFTFSKLKPYKDWKDLSSRANKAFESIRKKLPKSRVTRLCVRNINSIELPSNSEEMQDYFYVFPSLPPGIDQPLDGFSSRIMVDYHKKGVKVSYTMVSAGHPDPDKGVIILDTEVFKDIDTVPANKELWKILSELNDVKDEFFFQNITEKTRELFR